MLLYFLFECIYQLPIQGVKNKNVFCKLVGFLTLHCDVPHSDRFLHRRYFLEVILILKLVRELLKLVHCVVNKLDVRDFEGIVQ